ncbi:MAG: 4Fe-4S dicluster domain-containing protein [Betaproteobacteria bacterium]|nr:4Fe-4S dicluster domain-containing protein [Betaproteobacteria bacterium]
MDRRDNFQPEAPVQVDSTLCSRYRSTKSPCAACAVVCPVPGAVRLAEEGAVIGNACLGCGACVSACPNGALRLLPDGDARFSARIRERVQPSAVFRMACVRADGEAELLVPCLSRLTEALVMEPLRGGASRVELRSPDCSACGLAKAAPQWRKVVEFTQALCATAGLAVDRVAGVRTSVGKARESQPAAGAANPRRAMFRAVAERWEAIDVAQATSTATPPAPPEAFRQIVQRHAENPKRIALLEVLSTLPGAQPRSHVLPNVLPVAAIPVAQLEADSRCVGCNVCETLCPVSALAHREEAGNYVLELDAARCTGCRICEAVCYYQAIHVRATVDLAVLFDHSRIALVAAPKRTCRTCGESFLGESADRCPSCRQSGDRRDAVARRFFAGGSQSEQF